MIKSTTDKQKARIFFIVMLIIFVISLALTPIEKTNANNEINLTCKEYIINGKGGPKNLCYFPEHKQYCFFGIYSIECFKENKQGLFED